MGIHSRSSDPDSKLVSQSQSPKLDSNFVRRDFNTCSSATRDFTEIPVLDLSAPDARSKVVEACKEFGIFKVINHGVSFDFLAQLESEAFNFFHLPHEEKEKASPLYVSKRIGHTGDVGWVEYLLFKASPNFASSSALIPGISETLQSLVSEYVRAVQSMTTAVLDMVAEALGIEPVDSLAKMIKDEQSDCFFRLNHYPACSAIQGLNEELVGFGEHTDPQIMSVIRSNRIPGLQVCLRDGTWVSVPADPSSFFFIVGDCLQVMTNSRFRSLKHRVTANSSESRLSMIFFGGPALADTIGPLSSLMEEGESSLYKELAWSEYKKTLYTTRLGDDRVSAFYK